MLVVLPPMAGVSIVKLLTAAIIPGLVLSTRYIIRHDQKFTQPPPRTAAAAGGARRFVFL
jgi:hypothetical protein